jgi:hypothetical protein
MSDVFKSLHRSADWIRRLHLDPKGVAACTLVSCSGPKTLWQRLRPRNTGSYLHGNFYCRQECLEIALVGQLSRLSAMSPSAQPPNRIPLGLLMVARGKLTHLEVRAALEAQRHARYGKIGDWVVKLGFASEQDVTNALALQWGCPVVSSLYPSPTLLPGNIPLPILDAFQMLPINYAASTKTLYVAFGERVDHAALYGIEQILGCRTQPCVSGRRQIARQLESMRQLSRPRDVEFWTRDLNEMARITSSYLTRLAPEDIRLSRLGNSIWLRLKTRSAFTNVVFCMHPKPAQPRSSYFGLSPSLQAFTRAEQPESWKEMKVTPL